MQSRSSLQGERSMQVTERQHRTISFSLTTTATTADQEIGIYTPATKSHFVAQLIFIEVYLTVLSVTAVLLGKLSVYVPTFEEYLLKDLQASNTTSGAMFGVVLQIPQGWFEKHYRSPIRAICTPAVATSTKWIIQIVGYDE